MKVLVDNSVLRHAIEHKGEWKSSGTVMWGGENGIPVETGRIISKERSISINETKGGPQGRYIASLAIANANGKWEAHSSDALVIERFNKPISTFNAGNYGDFSWFKEVNCQNNDTLEGFQSKIHGDSTIKKLRDFLASSKDRDYTLIRDALNNTGAQKSSQDAWHNHCVRLLGLDMFLTCDTKLIGQIKNISDNELKEKLLRIVTLPCDLCSALDLTEATEGELETLRNKFSFFQ